MCYINDAGICYAYGYWRALKRMAVVLYVSPYDRVGYLIKGMFDME